MIGNINGDNYYDHCFDNSDVDYISDVDGAVTWSWHGTLLDGESVEKTVSFGTSITYERRIKYRDPITNDEIEENYIIGGAFVLPELEDIEDTPGYRQAWIQKQGDKITELESNVAIIPDNPDVEVIYYTEIVPIRYRILIDTNGGERIDTIFYTINDVINLPEAKKVGYKFTGWKVIDTDNEENWTVDDILSGTLDKGIMGNVLLEAQYEYKEFVLTIHDVNGVNIDPKGVLNVLYGDEQEINIIAEDTIAITSIKVNGVERVQDLKNNKLTLENIREDTEVIIEVKELQLEFDTESKNKVFNIDKDKNLSFRIINTNLNNFTTKSGEVYIDNILLAQDKYTVKSGSIIITLNEDFVKTLKIGKHEIKVAFNDKKEVKTNFELVETLEEQTSNPKTNDVETHEEQTSNPQTSDNIFIYIVIGLIFVVGLAGVSIYNKKNLVKR